MAHSNGKMTAPVSLLGDICPVLGISTSSAKYAVTNAHGKIKKWAKYKPVRIFGNAGILVDHDANPTWWKGSDGQCGLTIPKLASYAPGGTGSGANALKDLYDNGNADWTYNPPDGTRNYPARTGDFEGYNHNANTPPVFISTMGTRALYNAQGGNETIHLTCGYALDNPNSDTLALGDFTIGSKTLADYTLGFLVYDGTTYKGYAIGATDGSRSCSFNTRLNSLPMRHNGSKDYIQYKAYPFLASGRNLVNSNTFVTLPNVTPRTFIVCSFRDYYGLTVNPQATWTYMTTQEGKVRQGIKWFISIGSDTGVTVNILAALRFNTYKDFSVPMKTGEKYIVGGASGGVDYWVSDDPTEPLILKSTNNISGESGLDITKEYNLVIEYKIGGNITTSAIGIKKFASDDDYEMTWGDDPK